MIKAALVTGAQWRDLAVKLLSKLFLPFPDWIQVEVTSHCMAECVYFPHAVYQKIWQAGHMPIELFKKLSAAFRRTDLVYLHGFTGGGGWSGVPCGSHSPPSSASCLPMSSPFSPEPIQTPPHLYGGRQQQSYRQV